MVIPAATESLFAAKGYPNNEIATFRALKLRNITITNQPKILKSTRDQPLTRFHGQLLRLAEAIVRAHENHLEILLRIVPVKPAPLGTRLASISDKSTMPCAPKTQFAV